MQEPTIRREDRRTTAEAPALDPTLLRFSDAERKFLLSAIDEDEEKMREKVVEIQSESVGHLSHPALSQTYVGHSECRGRRPSSELCSADMAARNIHIHASACSTLSRR
jgi:Fe-S-cluster formation regulator IscX/YfhJ